MIMNGLFNPSAWNPWVALMEALLIGLLIGAQRETAKTGSSIGLRDMILIAAIAFVCGWLQVTGLTIACIVAIVAMLIALRMRDQNHVGITTELAGLAVFGLAYMVSVPSASDNVEVVIALAVVLTLVLEAKARVKKFFRETITDIEFTDTVKFLALIFVIYPILPKGRYGPNEFFSPTGLWTAVILVTGVSWVGYFLEKFLGPSLGKKIVAILGGLASTTASTSAFASEVRRDGAQVNSCWQAATLSNAMQFPRVLVLLAVFLPDLAWSFAIPLLTAFAAGVILSFVIGLWGNGSREAVPMELRNPLSFIPAILFAVLLAAVSFVSTAATQYYGGSAFMVTSAIGGLVDADVITLTAADLLRGGHIDAAMARNAIFIAIAANAVVKNIIALVSGTPAFARRMLITFGVLLAFTLLPMLFL